MNNTKKKLRIPLGPIVLALLLGCVFTGLSIFITYSRSSAVDGAVGIKAKVTDASDTVTVTYTYNDIEYKNISIVLFEDPAIGEVIHIYIDPSDPSVAFSDDTYQMLIKIYVGVAIFMFLLGAIPLYLRIRYGEPVDSYAKVKRFVYADVEKVVYEPSITNKEGEHPYIIHCHYEDFLGKKQKDFTLPPIYVNPYNYLAQKDNRVKLFVKRKNFKRFKVDPELTQEKRG